MQYPIELRYNNRSASKVPYNRTIFKGKDEKKSKLKRYAVAYQSKNPRSRKKRDNNPN